ncbi:MULTISPECIES: ABC transporter permease [Halobacterium]|uniref:ABC transporter permease n=1 Tax=Halobacterium TaxID=2239 RepID=UPI00073F402A|nr:MULTISPECIES: ABC transporter permease [Halobacterium]MCG1003233.1 ABC transporter permease [Halobacterium noricense]
MDVTNPRDLDASVLVEVLKSVYSLVIILVLWETVTQMGWIHYYFLPPLSDVLGRFVELTMNGKMLDNAYLTLKRAFLGLAIAIVAGVTVGVVSARNRVADWFFDPIIKIGYPVPIIALIPVFMLWFGIGDTSKIIMVAVGTFWPIAVNARQSTKQVEKNLVWAARMMGTSDTRLLWRVVLPAAAPGIVTGIQIALPLSLIITFVFEMIAGGGGLGALEIEGVRSFQSTQTYAAIIAIMLVGLLLDRLLRAARSRLLRWT